MCLWPKYCGLRTLGPKVYPQSMFWAKMRKNIAFSYVKIISFTAVKYCNILHGHVCVMQTVELKGSNIAFQWGH